MTNKTTVASKEGREGQPKFLAQENHNAPPLRRLPLWVGVPQRGVAGGRRQHVRRDNGVPRGGRGRRKRGARYENRIVTAVQTCSTRPRTAVPVSGAPLPPAWWAIRGSLRHHALLEVCGAVN